jgi:phospholipase/lecithinase/hemolysin
MLHIASQAARANRSLFAALLIAILAAPGLAAAATPSPHFVIFGDSLSDSGNVFVVNNVGFDEGANNVPPDYNFDSGLNPNAAYARGGHHITNGATWIEVLARDMHYGVNANAAFASDNPLATNYAVAGARANDRADTGAIDMGDEVDAFLSDFEGNAPSDALYVIEFGANDINDALLQANPALIDAALGAIGENIQVLYMAGARNFLVMSAPDMGLTPLVQSLGVGPFVSGVSSEFNLALQFLVLAPLQALPGIQIRYFDLYAAVDDLYANYDTLYGMTERSLPCVTPDVPPFVCQRPDQYLFWDGIHPTRAAHAILADKVETFLAQ